MAAIVLQFEFEGFFGGYEGDSFGHDNVQGRYGGNTVRPDAGSGRMCRVRRKAGRIQLAGGCFSCPR
jgi:hypothetical protein